MADLVTLDDLDVAGRRVLVRADLNVPSRDGRVADATRIEEVRPTVLELAGRGARVVLLSHLGRPMGITDPALSLAFVAAPAAELFGRPVEFVSSCVGAAAEKAVADLPEGGIALMENVRFHAGEAANDDGFADRLAALGDIFVNDAFSCAHRNHASTVGLAQRLPAAAGRHMERELAILGDLLQSPERPLVAVVGGAKVSSKLTVLGSLAGWVDMLIIGGGMANTFLFANGNGVGRSLCERERADEARAILSRARANGCEIILPTDVVIAPELAPGAAVRTVAIDSVPEDWCILDIGADSVARIADRFGRCRTLIWNGPLGAFETPPFDAGTVATARAAAKLMEAGKLMGVAGGGDTMAALNKAGVSGSFRHVSTAGGAFLEWLEGKTLPAIAALTRKGSAAA